MLHNCGPHPCARVYLGHDPPIAAVDAAYSYSKKDLPAFKEAFSGKGVLYIEFTDSVERNLAEYRRVMEVLAPDVIAIPCLTCGPGDDAGAIYRAFLEISREYAARIRWRD